ncbi:MAG: glycosyltransferase [Coriobacteriales bacterium]|jgi:dolichol-phosphate mannosyltransferase|nr:glycosyltransferase [Coriobacteriales bacterium]
MNQNPNISNRSAKAAASDIADDIDASDVTTSKTPDISVIIPAYNEQESLPALFAKLDNFTQTVDFSIQFVFVDDGSTDDTAYYIARHPLDRADTKLVTLSRNFGAHAALRAGILQADSDLCMFYSVDMPEPVEDIAAFYLKLSRGSDLVYSKRLGYRGSLGSKIYNKLVKRFVGLGFPVEGIIGVAFSRKIKRELNNNVESNSSIYFQIFSLGFKSQSIDVEYKQRQVGDSKWSLRSKIKLFIDSFVMFSYAPIRAISVIGIALALIGFIWALIILISKLVNPAQIEAGWPTLLGLLLIGFGVTNFSLGIIAEYLVRTLDAARRRPAFVIDTITDAPAADTANVIDISIPTADAPSTSHDNQQPVNAADS